MLMVRQAKSCNVGRSDPNSEVVSDGVESTAVAKSLAHPSHKQYVKSDSVAAPLGGSYRRWNAPSFLTGNISHQNSLLTGEKLDTDEHPMDSPLIILFQVNQQQENVIHSTFANISVSHSFSEQKGNRHTSNKSKRSKSGRDFCNRLSDGCTSPNKLPSIVCGNPTLECSGTSVDGTSKTSDSVKLNTRKKGKRKGRNHKKPPLGKDSIVNGAVHETNFHDFQVIEMYRQLGTCDSAIELNNVSNRDVASTSYSDSVDESEPPGSLGESACGSSICDLQSSTEDRCHQISFLNEMQAFKPSAFVKNLTNINEEIISTPNNTYSGNHGHQISDLLFDTWASDTSCHPEHENTKSMDGFQDQNLIQPLECQMVSKSFSKNCMLASSKSASYIRINDGCNGLVYREKFHNGLTGVADRSGCVNENESCDISNVCQSFMSKRRRHGRDSSGNPNSLRRFGTQNINTRMRRGTGHPIWLKVANKGVEGCNKKLQVQDIISSADVLAEHEPRSKADIILGDKTLSRLPNFVKNASYSFAYPSHSTPTCGMPDCHSNCEKVVDMIDMVPKNLSSILKGNDTQSSKSSPKNGKTRSFRHCKVQFPEHSAVNIQAIVGSQEQHLKSFVRSTHQKMVHSSQSCSSSTMPYTDSCYSVKGMCPEIVQEQRESATYTSSSLEHKITLGMQPKKLNAKFYPTELLGIHPVSFCNTESDLTSDTLLHTENCNHDYILLSPKKKWIAVGKKESPLLATDLQIVVDNDGSDSCTNNVIQKFNTSLDKNFTESLLIKNDDMKTNLVSESILMPVGRNGASATTAGSLTSKDMSIDPGLGKIMQAVDDASRLQAASELVHLQTGGPLAEFEKLLHSAAPEICQLSAVPNCQCCSYSRKMATSLCRHQVPNISLGNLWRWYEKRGSYGLEVKVEDQHGRKLGSCAKFRAYFVPYLSAVQLFGQSKSKVPTPGIDLVDLQTVSSDFRSTKDFSDTEKLPESVDRLSGPIFPLLLPQSKQGGPTEIIECLSSTEVHNCSSQVSCLQDDKKLLFEYFESDPPQQRPPLFEKIRMLVRGDVSLKSHSFGDASNLEYLHLHDIDPASWFSVAWYPIYRIPDGNLRAAFLTYHCLGNFSQRNREAKEGQPTYIESPVVGLQSYNSRGECWFQLGDHKFNSIKKETPPTNPSQILEERLRTLNQTATIMARASIQKHGQKSINRQPDYEFFVSRA